MKEITQDTQKILDTLKKVAIDTLERKRRLGEYAVVWQDNKPIIIGEMLEDSDDFRRETSLL
jgi:leucyl aminopeptidase (aminopeptidase T)